jgi:starvation-inducible DNA-binding protein
MATIQTDIAINIGIEEKNRNAVVAALTKILADEHVLYNKTRSYHWNVEGSSFMEFHKLFEDQYTQIAVYIDDIAERIRSLGSYTEGRLKELLKHAELEEPAIPSDPVNQVANLVIDHEIIIRNLRQLAREFPEKYEDDGSGDFVIGLMQQHEKTAWMLRSYLK